MGIRLNMDEIFDPVSMPFGSPSKGLTWKQAMRLVKMCRHQMEEAADAKVYLSRDRNAHAITCNKYEHKIERLLHILRALYLAASKRKSKKSMKEKRIALNAASQLLAEYPDGD
jgi:hypothetical protein